MKIIRLVLIASLTVAFLGWLFKIMLWPLSSMLLTLGLVMAAIVAFIQFVFCLTKLPLPSDIKPLYALSSIVISLNLISILFRYMFWPGLEIIRIVVYPLILIIAVLMFMNRSVLLEKAIKSFTIYNILIPIAFVFLLGVFPFMFSKKVFFETFSTRRNYMSYEEFLKLDPKK